MRFSAAKSDDPDLAEAWRAVRSVLGDAEEPPTLLWVFCSVSHGLTWDQLPGWIDRDFPGAAWIGCSAGGVLAEGVELEHGAGLAVMACWLPGVAVHPIRLPAEMVGGRDGVDDAAAAALLRGTSDTAAALVVMADPFSCHVDALASCLDRHTPYGPVVGALASGGDRAGRHALFLDGVRYDDGAVAVALVGDVQVDVVVAQGCTPVDVPRTVTRTDGRLVAELDARGALETLRGVFDAMDASTRKRFRGAPMVGVAMEVGTRPPQRGDFVVRHLVGVDPKRDAFAVAHPVREGDVVQLHVRDAAASVEDLQAMVARYRAIYGTPDGVLLFSCMGRGERLYGRPDIDSRTVRELLGDVPLVGFFGNGEIGPVQGRAYVHGYTAVAVMFRAAGWH